MNSALVQLVAELVADKVNVNQTVVEQNQDEEEDMVTLANLSRITTEIWKEISKDVQQTIMKVRLEENKYQSREERSEDKLIKGSTASAPLTRHYSKPKANMAQTKSPSLYVVDEFL